MLDCDLHVEKSRKYHAGLQFTQPFTQSLKNHAFRDFSRRLATLLSLLSD